LPLFVSLCSIFILYFTERIDMSSSSLTAAISGVGSILSTAYGDLNSLPNPTTDPAGYQAALLKMQLDMATASAAEQAVSGAIQSMGDGAKGAAHNIGQ
jgi:hypothetical protein